jgi:HEXXH motif-containing protein
LEKISLVSRAPLPDGITRHRLSTASFAVLSAGDGSPAITRDFWNTEESRRLLLVSTLLTEIEEEPASLGPLPPVAGMVEALSAAQRSAPAEVRGLLLDPEVGSGCAYALRRLRGGARGEGPLWVDLGVVHALAVAAAARAGLSWSTRLPLRNGNVMIPSHGMARFGEGATATTVEAYTKDGRIRLSDGVHEIVAPVDASDVDSGDAGIGWWSLRRIRVGDELPLTVWIDDLDPLRDLADPVPPARLGPGAFQRWHRLIGDAWELLCRDYRREAEAMAEGVVSIVPLKHEPGWDTRSASNGEAFGSIMLSEPPNVTTMAVSLIHEYQHIKLGALLHLIPLTGPDDGSLYYAPWRDDPRPLAGLVQGIYAFFGITRFWRIRRDKTNGSERALAAFEYAYARQQTVESVQIALAAPGLTEQGRQLFEGLRSRLDEWSRDPADAVDPRIDRLATITADSHRIGWRLRHFRPREEDVAALARQWAQRTTSKPGSPASAAIRAHSALRWEQRIPAAARRHASTVITPADGAGGDPPGGVRDALTAGENALLARDAQVARAAFAGAIGQYAPAVHDVLNEVSDEEARAWAGLAVSLAAAGDTAAATALSRRPDLVRAVYTESRAAASLDTTPADVAQWLVPVLSTGEPAGPL